MVSESQLAIKAVVLLIPFILIVLRLVVVLPSVKLRKSIGNDNFIAPNVHGSTIMIMLGSGGHTGEMIRLLSKVKLENFNRIWVSSSGDSSSLIKAKEYEENLKTNQLSSIYLTLYRARKVGESIPSSIISTIKSFISTFNSLIQLKELPSLVLLNGPGTCVPLAYILFILKFFGLAKTKIVYIESLARVNKLSLSGKLLLPISDRFIVQWEKLALKYERAEFYGILV
ncbi:UDP-N-acetylglucosamine transferase subunit ALG14 [Scheffersomyces amazonensis]|uniref:UDP-N-acetylglucosamine transferase subunit ALG14 n=1 Tax=Scheffersomyces amazonensis TaxID=1078765 RepID=UPI00315DF83C